MTIFNIKHADKKSRAEARHELGAIVTVSLLPLIFGFLFSASQQGPLAGAMDVFLSGDLYFYAVSFCAAILVLAIIRNERGNKYLMLWVAVFVIACIGLTSLYLGQGGGNNEADSRWHGWASVPMLLMAVWMYYRVLVLTSAPPPPPEEVNRSSANELAEEVDVDYDS